MSITLYHGSRFKQSELMPGFKRTGVEVKWDGTESNHFLYATTVKETAMSLGFASSIEKAYHLPEYHTDGNKIRILSKDTLSLASLYNLDVYIYTIEHTDDDEWVKNDNAANKLDSEWKTTKTITKFLKLEKLDVKEWLKDKEVTIEKVADTDDKVAEEKFKENKPPAFSRW